MLVYILYNRNAKGIPNFLHTTNDDAISFFSPKHYRYNLLRMHNIVSLIEIH